MTLLYNNALTMYGFMGLLIFSHVTTPITLIIYLALVYAVLLSRVVNNVLPITTRGLRISPTIVTSPLVAAVISAAALLVCFGVTGVLLRLWGVLKSEYPRTRRDFQTFSLRGTNNEGQR